MESKVDCFNNYLFKCYFLFVFSYGTSSHLIKKLTLELTSSFNEQSDIHQVTVWCDGIMTPTM